MNLQPLYNVKERLRASAIAGVELLDEDFRLKRAVQELEPLTAAGAVFAKLQARLDALLTAPPKRRAGALLDALALTDAILYTQGRTGAEGELMPLTPRYGNYIPLSYEQIRPLTEALTTTGSGRYNTLKQAFEEHPDYFGDYRILPKVIDGLGDRYAEIGELCSDILSAQGEPIIPLLKKGFNPAGGHAMQLRVKTIARAADESGWVLAQLPAAKKDVRAELLLSLGKSAEHIPCLLELSKTERGNNRDAVLFALGAQDCDTPQMRIFWEDELTANSEAVRFLNKKADWASDLVAKHFRQRLERILQQRTIDDKNQWRDLHMWIDQVRGRVSPATEALWLWIDEHFDALESVEDRSRTHKWESVEKVETLLMQNLFFTLCEREEMSELCLRLYRMHRGSPRYVSHGLIASLLTQDAAEVYEEFSPMLLTEQSMADDEEKRKCHNAVLSALYSSVFWDKEKKTHCIRGGRWDVAIRTCRQPLDSRWLDRMVNCVRDDKALPFVSPGWDAGIIDGQARTAGFDYMIVSITDPDNAEMCEKVESYLRCHMMGAKRWYGYCSGLLHIGKSPRGALKSCFTKKYNPPARYALWKMLEAASKRLPAAEVIAIIEEILEAEWLLPIDEKAVPQGRIRDGEYPFWSDRTAVRSALVDSAERLEMGQPFPPWEAWMNV